MAVDLGTAITGKPWLSQYDQDVPPTLAPYPADTLVDVVRGPHENGQNTRR